MTKDELTLHVSRAAIIHRYNAQYTCLIKAESTDSNGSRTVHENDVSHPSL